jgi:hypothetical protein
MNTTNILSKFVAYDHRNRSWTQCKSILLHNIDFYLDLPVLKVHQILLQFRHLLLRVVSKFLEVVDLYSTDVNFNAKTKQNKTKIQTKSYVSSSIIEIFERRLVIVSEIGESRRQIGGMRFCDLRISNRIEFVDELFELINLCLQYLLLC